MLPRAGKQSGLVFRRNIHCPGDILRIEAYELGDPCPRIVVEQIPSNLRDLHMAEIVPSRSGRREYCGKQGV
jgi:hypothetical protein